jgi:hypothetical protein
MSTISMSMRTRAGVLFVLVLAVALPIVGIAFRPTAATPSPGASPGRSAQVAVGSPTSAPSGVTAAIDPSATPLAAPGPTPFTVCELPASLPAAPVPVATPIVGQRSVAMLFTSYLYDHLTDGPLIARDSTSRRSVATWAVGLWFVAPGNAAPQLLAAPEGGVVLPLALSPAGDKAVVWWLPERRGRDEPMCESGIYAMATDGSESHLLMHGDWSEASVDPPTTPTWIDPDEGRFGGPRSYVLPKVSFSANEALVAIATDLDIKVVLVDEPGVVMEHIGSCPRSGWAATGATFAAGCERMTSAWVVDANDGISNRNLALPQPDLAVALPNWESAAAIGFDRHGRIVVVRFYGLAIGCEADPCRIPSPGYTFSTIDPHTGRMSSRGAGADFLVRSSRDESPSLASNAAWVYALVDGRAVGDPSTSRVIDFATGRVRTGIWVGTLVGSSADGRLLYGMYQDVTTRRVVVQSIDATGSTRDVVAITSAPALAAHAVIDVWGLVVARA